MEHEKLIAHLHEELQDVEGYMEMYQETNCGVYKDLAHDEMSHARILKNKCIDEGVDVSPYLEACKHAEHLLHK